MSSTSDALAGARTLRGTRYRFGIGEGFAQLASISAVLGGFTVTFLAVVLTLADARRLVGVTIAFATAAAVCFFA